MATKITPNGTDYTIVLDASFDLYAAGRDNSDESCADFAATFRGAAQELADETGISIRVVTGSYDGPAMQDQTENGDEGDLWQAIHDKLSYDAEENEWTY